MPIAPTFARASFESAARSPARMLTPPVRRARRPAAPAFKRQKGLRTENPLAWRCRIGSDAEQLRNRWPLRWQTWHTSLPLTPPASAHSGQSDNASRPLPRLTVSVFAPSDETDVPLRERLTIQVVRRARLFPSKLLRSADQTWDM
jgi:hypothetical protein